ncbi:MAG TPA: EamA family transporter, partial [Arenimonas sp.]|nr:EamA family transporter [Arenimonas sp.]
MPHAAAERHAFWQIHFCVLLWGFTAILGKLITLPAQALVVWRMGLVALFLALIPKVWRAISALPARLILIYAGIGIIVAVHWLTFYAAIKLSNASVAVSCMALGSIFAAIVEPFMTGRKHEISELILGIMVVPGVVLLVGGVPTDMHLGIVIGIFSSFLTAVFATLNKRYVHHAEPESVTFIEMSVGGAFMAIAGIVYFGVDSTM